MDGTTTGILIHAAVQLTLIVRVLLRPHREPASRVAWIVVVAAAPVVGILSYLLFGETSIGRARIARMNEALRRLPPPESMRPDGDAGDLADVPRRLANLFRTGRSISGFEAATGNTARLAADSNAAIGDMVADIDAATDHVHLLFYIWLADGNGCKMVDALCRAARRGVTCRALADSLGSRAMIASSHWRAMREAGVQLGVALPIGNPVVRAFDGRIDLRNHRKILVIDGAVTYCGSQNCADPEFRVKAKYAPWVDVMFRFEGPVVMQNQHLFASDWMTYVDEDLSDLLAAPAAPRATGFLAQVIGTGPTVRYSAMPELFEAVLHAAERELIITTPYYVPNESMQSALCAAAYRGVDVTIIFPERNDSWIVAAASRSYYRDLLAAGVKIFENRGGLLHAKSITLDGQMSLIGSANMDRRSFELNYENNILLWDPPLTQQLRERQQQYLASSTPVTPETVDQWPLRRRLWNNTIAMLGPVL
ncbi:MAG: cardiolipin synthase [Planctomycetaceae bacterium]|nr:cardiolipin synthase [Planctomycetaceae bacterium]